MRKQLTKAVYLSVVSLCILGAAQLHCAAQPTGFANPPDHAVDNLRDKGGRPAGPEGSSMPPLTPVSAPVPEVPLVPAPAAPILRGSTPATILPEDAAPLLQGQTNGTIGPPGCNATAIMDQGGRSGVLPVTSILVFSLAVSVMLVFCQALKRAKRGGIWVMGSAAALVLVVTGYVWGSTCLF